MVIDTTCFRTNDRCMQMVREPTKLTFCGGPLWGGCSPHTTRATLSSSSLDFLDFRRHTHSTQRGWLWFTLAGKRAASQSVGDRPRCTDPRYVPHYFCPSSLHHESFCLKKTTAIVHLPKHILGTPTGDKSPPFEGSVGNSRN